MFPQFVWTSGKEIPMLMLYPRNVRQLLALADAMVKGAKKRPQANGNLFTIRGPDTDETKNVKLFKIGASCALGAVYEGAFGTPPVKLNPLYAHESVPYFDVEDFVANGGDGKMNARLTRRFPVLRLGVPEKFQPHVVTDDESGPQGLDDLIVSLNDQHGWTRAKIAQWIRRLAMKIQSKGYQHGD